MSYGQPNLVELVRAVSLYLEETAMPALTGRAAFHGRVAVNVLGTIAREIEHGPHAHARERDGLAALMGRDDDLDALRAALCADLRAGRKDADTPGLVAALLAAAIDRVAIEQPSYASLRLAREAAGDDSPKS